MLKILSCVVVVGLIASCDTGSNTRGVDGSGGATHITLRFRPEKPLAAVRYLDVRVAVKDGTVQTGRVKAARARDDDGTANEIEMQIERGTDGRLILRPWPPPADTGYSISFTAPNDPAGTAEWPDGSLIVTTDAGDTDGGMVKVGTR